MSDEALNVGIQASNELFDVGLFSICAEYEESSIFEDLAEHLFEEGFKSECNLELIYIDWLFREDGAPEAISALDLIPWWIGREIPTSSGSSLP